MRWLVSRSHVGEVLSLSLDPGAKIVPTQDVVLLEIASGRRHTGLRATVGGKYPCARRVYDRVRCPPAGSSRGYLAMVRG